MDHRHRWLMRTTVEGDADRWRDQYLTCINGDACYGLLHAQDPGFVAALAESGEVRIERKLEILRAIALEETRIYHSEEPIERLVSRIEQHRAEMRSRDRDVHPR